MSQPLLGLRGVRRAYGTGSQRVEALQDVTFQIFPNEYVAIVGPSGGGKSTLLAVLGLLEQPSTGTYEVMGVDTAAMKDAELTSLRATTFGFVFQAFHLLEHRRVSDSVELGNLYRGLPRSDRARAGSKALKRLGLGDRGTSLAKVLSGGQRQRVAIARAISTEDPIILADEPTGNLDSVSGAAVLDALDDLHAAGTTIVLVTHSAEVAARASRVITLVDGRVASDSEAESVAKTVPLPPRMQPGKLRARDVLRDAVLTFISRPRDAFTRMGAVAIAVALTLITLGISASASAQVSSSFDARANIEVSAQWQAGGVSLEEAVQRVSQLAGVTDAAAISDLGETSVSVRTESRSATLHGVAGTLAESTGSNIDWSNELETQLKPGEAVIGKSLAQSLRLPALAASPVVGIDGKSYVVVGIIEESRRFPRLAGEIIISEADALEIQPTSAATLAIVTQFGAAQQIGSQVALSLDPKNPNQYKVSVPVDPQTLRNEVENGVQVTLIAFTILAALTAILTLSNAISSSVFARRSEFGLRRAVGARSHHLAALVTTESAIVGFLGGAVGLMLGMLVILIFTIVQRWLPVFDWTLAPLALIAGIVLAILSSVTGALHAARIRPSEALRL
ncbi:macrolide transport system ATP-binding/permease protein [Microbacterium testaceum]|uniref:ABC transporter ATP-binding protein/permease n=1 Tax=Microbacterium testaceum TaxID=2033 RepID=UPI00278612C8|nr:ABC transporter ATP-binding protein/permease [Microbacterium testaceum]MDQ1175015.1 macrolide transport system ATP-binding/permease protein [Microbacterium testaceum]